MNIKVVVVGDLQTNCYIIEKGNSCLVIDPGAEPERILANIDTQKKVVGILITHSHPDHIGAITDIFNRFNCPIYSKNNLKEGTNTIDNFTFDVVPCPGHLNDAVSFYFKDYKIMFDGDFIFKGGIGRTDMDGANNVDMKLSIQKMLDRTEDITLYPGHGEPTTLNAERPYLKYFFNVL